MDFPKYNPYKINEFSVPIRINVVDKRGIEGYYFSIQDKHWNAQEFYNLTLILLHCQFSAVNHLPNSLNCSN